MMTAAEREAHFARYEAGPALLRAAWDRIPAAARQWRPAPGKWTAHEVILHCADSETNSSMRIRYLVGEPSPTIHGYDQDRWAVDMKYHELPVDPAFRQIESVRAWTAVFIRSLDAKAWARAGRHTEVEGPWTAETWLKVYTEHLEIHARQLQRNLDAWNAKPS